MSNDNTLNPAAYLPTKPSDFIGPARQVAEMLLRKVKDAKEDAKNYGPIRMLLYGAPGVGKTRLLEMMAGELVSHPTDIESTNGRNLTIEVVRDWVYHSHFRSTGFTVKIVNELDTATPAALDLLLTYLDDMKSGQVFAGTTNADLDRAFMSRFSSRLQLVEVPAPDVRTVAQFISRRWLVKKDKALELCERYGGNVRGAFMAAQTVVDSYASA